jgi:hypothetical protein
MVLDSLDVFVGGTLVDTVQRLLEVVIAVTKVKGNLADRGSDPCR